MMQLPLLVLLAGVAAFVAPSVEPVKYERIPGHSRYYFSTEPKTWNDAKRACEADGASLAVLNSYDEAMALQRILVRYRGDFVAHVGFHDQNQEGTYATVLGGTLDTAGHYNVWKYQPSGNALNQANDCGGMFNCGRLTDLPCNEKHPFFCELA